MRPLPVITAVANVLAHVPGLVRYGSRPSRDLRRDGTLLDTLRRHLRSYQETVVYPPTQVYIGNLEPEDLRAIPQPWFRSAGRPAGADGAFGVVLGEGEFLGLLRLCDRAHLVQLDEPVLAAAREGLLARGLATAAEFGAVEPARPEAIERAVASGEAIPLWLGERIVGSIARGHEEDEALSAQILLENLAAKATGVLALRRLLAQQGGRLAPDDLDFVLAGSEEAVGDRYQRGGGNLAKAIAEQVGVRRSTGFDIKAFCASTLYAVFNAAALVKAGLFSRVAVVAGGSLAKLGMKYRAHVARAMPVLEDVLAGVAVLVEAGRDEGPAVRLDTVGFHGAGIESSQQAVVEALVMQPLAKAGCRLTEVDRYATEMHNPEVTVPAGSGDVPLGNYRLIAALGAMRGHIGRDQIAEFITRHGMPGFAPTQGHIASAVCYLGHAVRAMRAGRMSRALFMAKGSLFLGRMTQLSDGVSFLVTA